MIFGGISYAIGNNEEIYEFIIRIIINIVFNFTLGAIMAFFSFTWNIVGLVWSYSSGILGLVFLSIAVISATSCLISYIYLIFLAGRGATMTILDLGKGAQRIRND